MHLFSSVHLYFHQLKLDAELLVPATANIGLTDFRQLLSKQDPRVKRSRVKVIHRPWAVRGVYSPSYVCVTHLPWAIHGVYLT